ncbi:hypothetical protein CL633_03310 [bacterium]|nr:hypothetical protein [bacterium]|tara:strand:- start:2643 stop:3287 length:645 start_codon:yes stop_codon:yes gene_type:complete
MTSSQQLIEINTIKDGVIILKNKALRAILMVSSLNFALKSEDERKALILAFQNFLNSLDFPIQISIQSRKLNIKQYTDDLAKKAQEQENELLRIQTQEYSGYIDSLVEMTNVMNKNFFITIPFSPIESKREGILDKVKKVISPSGKIKFTKEDFARYKEQLWQRVEYIASGLASMGISAKPLNTQELIEMFYELYNPGISPQPGLAEVKELELR